MEKNLKLVEGEIVPIYENEKGEKLINARELHMALQNKRKFSDWIKQRIDHYKFLEYQDFFTFHNFVKRDQKDNLGSKMKEYYITIDMAKELCMVENNEIGRKIRKYFIEAIARVLGMKISYKHYYEDEEIAIVPDISKGNQYYQIYYKPKAVNEIINWFNENKKEAEYKIIYEKNTKNGKRGEVKEHGYKIENVCYKININKKITPNK